jgi:glycerophosphoryl diester phosphodiesterase
MADAAPWLIARPIAHRGLHEAASGIIENTAPAFAGAIAGAYAIECDVQVSADGEAMVFHDDTLDRLTTASGPVAGRKAADLVALPFKAGASGMGTLADLFAQVQGRVPLVVEIKSRFDGDLTLTRRTAALAAAYAGPVALMSFDPAPIAWLRTNTPRLMRGIVAETRYDGAYWAKLPAASRDMMERFSHYPQTEPDFLSWRVADLPSPATSICRHALRKPVICWTVRNAADRAQAAAHADQVTFEGYRP